MRTWQSATPWQANSAIFLDRDGVVNANRDDYVKSIDEIEIYPQAFEAFRILASLPYKIIVVTNQSCVGRGYVSHETLHDINAEIAQRIIKQGGAVIDAFYSCIHHPRAGCDCRKPRTRLFTDAMKEYNIRGGCMIGDGYEDMVAAKSIGLIPMLVRTGRGKETIYSHPFFNARRYDSILEAAQEIKTWKLATS